MEILQENTLRDSGDEEIISRILAGEKELYQILLRRYNQTLFRAIRSYVKNPLEVEDLMQNTYLQAFEKLYQYRGEAAFRTWLIRIGINQALMYLRQHKRHHQLFTPADDVFSYQIRNISDQNMANPEKKIIQEEYKQLFETAVDQLPEKFRAVFVLREIEGISNQDVAQCLGLSESNVKVRLHRAKIHLKEILYNLTFTKDIFEFGNVRCDRLVMAVLSLI